MSVSGKMSVDTWFHNFKEVEHLVDFSRASSDENKVKNSCEQRSRKYGDKKNRSLTACKWAEGKHSDYLKK